MTAPLFRRNLFLTRPSMRGDDVLALQQGLRLQGAGIDPDGLFGLATQSAVRAFQASRTLVQDGVAGLATWAALFGGRADAQIPSVDGPPRTCFDTMVGKGWSTAQACGIVANIEHESKFDPAATGDGLRAYGLAQWHPDRQEAFQQLKGHSIHGSSLADQLDFIDWEMTKGQEQRAGTKLRAATTAREAGEVVSRFYERPAAVDAQANIRGACAEGYFSRFSGSHAVAPSEAAGSDQIGPAHVAADIFGGEHIRSLLQPHRMFQDSRKWLLSAQGVRSEDESSVRVDGPGRERANEVYKAYEPALLSVLGRGQVPIELVLAAICSVYDLKGAARPHPGADTTNPARTPDLVVAGLMQTSLGMARLVLDKKDLGLDDLQRPELSISAGAGAMWLRAMETNYDPPLVAAMYSAGDLRYDKRSRWKLLQYGLGSVDYVDTFVGYFNAAMAATEQLTLPPGVVTFHRLIEGYAAPVRSSASSHQNYVAQAPLSWIGLAPVDGGECVALVRKATGAPQSKLWRAGDLVRGKLDVPTGAAIATFDADGSYGSRPDGTCHAALYVKQDPAGITVVDQWQGHPPNDRVLHFDRPNSKRVDQGEEFRIVT